MSREKMTEATFARRIVAHFSERGFDVYQEVQCFGPRADIVAVRGKLLVVAETKLSLGLDVMQQAFEWIGHANLVYVATPHRPTRFKERVLKYLGIGALGTHSPKHVGGEIEEYCRPRLFRKRTDSIEKRLCDEQKTFAEAGNADGRFWTSFKGTCRAVENFVAAHDGCTLAEMVKEIDHHYGTDATAKRCMAGWIERGKMPGVSIERRGRLIVLRADESLRARAPRRAA